MGSERKKIISDLKMWRDVALYVSKYADHMWVGDLLHGDYWLAVSKHHDEIAHSLDKVIAHLKKASK